MPGVFVAGNILRDVQLSIVAAAEGARAAFGINRALTREDFARRARQTRGGSVCRSKCRCLAIAAMNGCAAASPRPSSFSTPGSSPPSGEQRGNARRVEQLRAGAEREDRLAVAVLVLDELERVAGIGERATALAPPGTTTASNSTEGAVSSVTSTSISRAVRGRDRAQPRPDEARHRALRRQARACNALQRVRLDTPSATRIAMRRVRMLPSPGRANKRQRRRALHFRLACCAASRLAAAPARRCRALRRRWRAARRPR